MIRLRTVAEVLPTVDDLTAGTDATAASLWPVSDILDRAVPVAFDHAWILRDTLDRTSCDLASTDLALAFVRPRFTLAELRGVYEAIWDIRIDPANFRRTVLNPDQAYVEPTGRRERPGSEGGRPPELYRAVPAGWLDGGPLRRPRSLAKSQSNKRLFAEVRSLQRRGRLREALELVPSHWTSERTAILAALESARMEADEDIKVLKEPESQSLLDGDRWAE